MAYARDENQKLRTVNNKANADVDVHGSSSLFASLSVDDCTSAINDKSALAAATMG